MSAIESDQSIDRNSTVALDIAVTNLGSSGLGAFTDARFTAKRDLADDDSAAIISKTLASGITITTNGGVGVDGVLTVAITQADTAALPTGYAVALVYDVRLYDAAGDGYPVAKGTLTVTPTATQATS